MKKPAPNCIVSRVCEVKLLGNHEFTLRQQKYRVSEALKTGEASALFGAHFLFDPNVSVYSLENIRLQITLRTQSMPS